MATATEALFCGKDKFVKWEAYWCRRVITEIFQRFYGRLNSTLLLPECVTDKMELKFLRTHKRPQFLYQMLED